MDIRGFFTPVGGKSKPSKQSEDTKQVASKKAKPESKQETAKRSTKAKRKAVVISDSDEEPLPEEIRERKQAKKKASIVYSDEDESVNQKSPKKKITEKSSKSSKPVSRPEKKEKLVPTTADAFFSDEPMPSTSKSKEKAKGNVDKTVVKSIPESPEKTKKSSEKSKSVVPDSSKMLFTFLNQVKEKAAAKVKSIPESPDKVKKSPGRSKPTNDNSSTKISLANKLSRKVAESEAKTTLEKPAKTTPDKKVKSSKSAEVESKKRKNEAADKVETPPKKLKTSDKSALTDVQSPTVESPQVHEEKTQSKKAGYRTFMAREGPQALGSKDIPEGAENCLEGMTFVITGVLDSIEREQASDLVKKHGGKVTQAVSKRTSYLIVGRDAGQSKLDKAKNLGTKQLDEDGLFDLIKKQPGKKSSFDKEMEKPKESPKLKKNKVEIAKEIKKIEKKEFTSLPQQSQPINQNINTAAPESLLWVDKYKPTTMKEIVGQTGDKSNAKKLYQWLLDWKKNRSTKKPNYFSGKETGSIFKAALLSGSPGVGKTTTATLVCKEANFSFVELNASDARNKKTLGNAVAGSLKNTSIDSLFKGRQICDDNHVLIMDEVDGMAGNEDRGGMQELITMIKASKVPVICMCNDRNHQKIRSLSNHCFDLRFHKPRVEQIKGFAMKVAFKEGLKIPAPAIEQIVIGANQDMRQVLHNMQMWTSTNKSLSFDDAKEEAKTAYKNIKLGPFEVVRKLLSASDERSKMSIIDKTALFFMDYSFIPLFIQENYLHCRPVQARGNGRKHMELISQAADSIADSNLIESMIRGSSAWSLLPLQGFYSCVVPTDAMYGGLGQKIEFPQWLGKNSSRSKHDRILQELKTHMMLSMHGNKTDLNLDYLWMIKNRMMEPLTDQSLEPNDAAKSVIGFMDTYSLIREDWDSISDISKWSDTPNAMEKIPSKVKSAFTRLYNKGSHMTPYSMGSSVKRAKAGKSTAAVDEDNPYDDDDKVISEESDNDDDNDITKDPNIKIGSGKTAKKSTSGKGKSSAVKGSGKGKGAAKR